MVMMSLNSVNHMPQWASYEEIPSFLTVSEIFSGRQLRCDVKVF